MEYLKDAACISVFIFQARSVKEAQRSQYATFKLFLGDFSSLRAGFKQRSFLRLGPQPLEALRPHFSIKKNNGTELISVPLLVPLPRCSAGEQSEPARARGMGPAMSNTKSTAFAESFPDLAVRRTWRGTDESLFAGHDFSNVLFHKFGGK